MGAKAPFWIYWLDEQTNDTGWLRIEQTAPYQTPSMIMVSGGWKLVLEMLPDVSHYDPQPFKSFAQRQLERERAR